MELALILVPSLAAVAAFLWPSDRSRPWFLLVAAPVHAALSIALLVAPPAEPFSEWLGFDPLARALLPAVSLLFLGCALYGVPYLALRAERRNRAFVASMLAALGLMSAAHMARHLGLLWIATEAVTLASVPMLHFNDTPRAYEATWKYLLVGGTGVALSLLGSFCLGYASLHGGGEGDLRFVALMAQGEGLSRPWLLIAWVLLLVGYGTKMGLAPMHTWKPDAYGEAPGIVGALLAGGVTTVAFAALLRVRAVVDAAGEAAITSRTLLFLGLLSTLVAALFLLVDARLQAHARLLERRAHGHPRHRGGAGRRGRVGGALPRVEQHDDEGLALPERRQRAARPRARTLDRRRDGMSLVIAALGRALRRRASSPSRPAALRAVLQRAPDRCARSFESGRGWAAAALPRLPAPRVPRAHARLVRDRATAGRAPRCERTPSASARRPRCVVPPLPAARAFPCGWGSSTRASCATPGRRPSSSSSTCHEPRHDPSSPPRTAPRCAGARCPSRAWTELVRGPWPRSWRAALGSARWFGVPEARRRAARHGDRLRRRKRAPGGRPQRAFHRRSYPALSATHAAGAPVRARALPSSTASCRPGIRG